jgi:hypothetical protein
MRLASFSLLLLALSPVVASANPKPPEARSHTESARDRSPKLHLHAPSPHRQ